jgi:hypothetical protein
MSKAKETAQKILDVANELGWEVQPRGDVLTIHKYDIVDNESFVRADMEYYSILGLMPQTSPGSIWGTDGGGIGALSAMSGRHFVMNMSGCSKRVMNALRKLV